MIAIGVDYGFRRVAIACAEMGWATSVYTPKLWDRGLELRVLATCLDDQEHETHMFIEGAIGAGPLNIQTIVGMAATQGALMLAHNGPSTIVAVSSWKKGVIGNGSADKELVGIWLAEIWPNLYAACDTQDEIDAMCMSLYGKMLISGDIAPPAPKKKHKKKVKTNGPEAS